MKKYLLIFILSFGNLYADYPAKIMETISLTNGNKTTVKARITEGLYANQVISGHFSSTQSGSQYSVTIDWFSLEKKGEPIETQLKSTFMTDDNYIKSGTNIIIRGQIKNDKDDEKSKENQQNPFLNTTRNNFADASNGSSGGSYSPPTPVIEFNERFITSLECPLVVDREQQTATIMAREYSVSKATGKMILKRDCYQTDIVKPLKIEQCDIQHNYQQGSSITREKSVILDDANSFLNDKGGSSSGSQATERVAMPCMPQKTYEHKFNEDICTPIVDGDKYYKTGKIYYKNEQFEEVTLTDCILNPKGSEALSLLVDYDGCPVEHLIDQYKSIYFGKYYYVTKDNSKRTVSQCMLSNKSELRHKIEFVKWENFDNDRYALKWQKTFVLYPEGTQQYELLPDKPVYITGNETDKIRYEYVPINIESRANNYPMVIICQNQWGDPRECEYSQNPNKPNPSAKETKYGYADTCGPAQNPYPCTKTAGKWEWTDYEKQCNVVYKRPDNSTLNLNNWWTLIRSWDQAPVNNAICK